MIKRKRKILKIILISISALAVILIFISILLNSYIRKTIEASLNETLNAKVSIEKARFRLFSSSIEIRELKIIGLSEFDNEVLLSVDKACIKLKDYSKKENKIIFKSFELENPTINNVTLESGLNSWKDCVKKQATDTSINELNDLTLFCENIVINNAEFRNENRKNKKIQYLHDIYIEVSIWEDQNIIGGDYKYRSAFDIQENQISTLSFNINASGGIFLEDSEFRSYSKLEINNKPFNLDVNFNFDSIANKPSKLRFNADLANWDFGQNVKSKGDIDLKIELDGIFNDLIIPSIKINVNTTDLTFINKQTNDSAYFDLGLEFDYNINENMLIGLKSYDFNATLIDDSISGNFIIDFNDTACIANSDISGELDLSNLKFIFSDSDINFEGMFALNSNLNGILNSKSNTLNGEFELEYSDKNNNNYFSLFLNNKNLKSYLKIQNNYITGSSDFYIPAIENIYCEKSVDFICNTNINKIEIPLSKNSESKIPQSFNSKTPQISFPKLSITNYKFTIDTLLLGDILLTKINADFIYSPNKMGINNLNLLIGNNRIISSIYLENNNNGSIELTSKLDALNFDLSYFTKKSQEISGILNIQSNNHLFSIDDSILVEKNLGENQITLRDFKLKNSILQEYEIDEDYIIIDSLDLNVDIDKNMLVLSPTKFKINEIGFAGQANMDINSGKILIETFIDVPDKYLSPEVKLLISLFSESANKKSSIKNKNIYKLRVSGITNNLNYKIIEY